MALVAYSDSEGSESEAPTKPQPQNQPGSSTTAPTASTAFEARFKIDKADPRKIKVNLRQIEENNTSLGNDQGEPAAKRPRVGGGFGGFNSMLPAPKQRQISSANGFKNAQITATRKVFSLKTGAEPGFSRDSDAELKQLFSEQSYAGADPLEIIGTSAKQTLHEGTGMSTANGYSGLDMSTQPVRSSEGKPMMFKPLSVARNTEKKKQIKSKEITAQDSSPTMAPAAQSSASTTAGHPTSGPKPNLFSIGSRDGPDIPTAEFERPDRNDTYDEINHNENNILHTFDHNQAVTAASTTTSQAAEQPNEHPTQSLTSIADDLNLPASARRQLLGRKSKQQDPITANNIAASNANPIIKTFDTNAEYAANNQSLLTLAQQQQQLHNPVRAIAPGKHSLKQLVSVASGQKEALEESFAAGRRNQSEGRGRYGW